MAEAAYHVPSLPRGLLLPRLDTYEVRDEEPDPTPPGSHVSGCLLTIVYRLGVMVLRRPYTSPLEQARWLL